MSHHLQDRFDQRLDYWVPGTGKNRLASCSVDIRSSDWHPDFTDFYPGENRFLPWPVKTHAELCDESRCYCDNPHKCHWNRSTGPTEPNQQHPARCTTCGKTPCEHIQHAATLLATSECHICRTLNAADLRNGIITPARWPQ